MPTASRRPLPDFLVVGGQRCGTTSLYRYLVQHPSVLFPRLTKGTHWFDEEYHRSEAWYRSNFPLDRVASTARAVETGGPVVVGEACPYYLFHPEVPARIAEHLPDVKVDRHPPRPGGPGLVGLPPRVPPRATRRSASSRPSTPSRTGWPAPSEVLAAGPTRHLSHQHHGYVARGRYAEQLERLWSHVDRERCLVLYTADLERDPSTR